MKKELSPYVLKYAPQYKCYRQARSSLAIYRVLFIVLAIALFSALHTVAYGQGSLSAGAVSSSYTDPSSGFVLTANFTWDTFGNLSGPIRVTNPSGMFGPCTIDFDGSTGFTSSVSGTVTLGRHYYILSYNPPPMTSLTVSFTVFGQSYFGPVTLPANPSPNAITYWFAQGGTIIGSYSQPIGASAFTSSFAAPSAFPGVTVSTSQDSILPNGAFDYGPGANTLSQSWPGVIPIIPTGTSSQPVTVLPNGDNPTPAPGTQYGPPITIGDTSNANLPIWTTTTSTVGLDLTNFQTATDQVIRDANANTASLSVLLSSLQLNATGLATNELLTTLVGLTTSIASGTTTTTSPYTISTSNAVSSLAANQALATASATTSSVSVYGPLTGNYISTISSNFTSSFSAISSSLSNTQENISSETRGDGAWPVLHMPILGTISLSPYQYPTLMNILKLMHDIILCILCYEFINYGIKYANQYMANLLIIPQQSVPVAAEDLVPVAGNIASRLKGFITLTFVMGAVIAFYGAVVLLINSNILASGFSTLGSIHATLSGTKFAALTGSLQGSAAWMLLNDCIPLGAMWQLLVGHILLQIGITPLFGLAAFVVRISR